MTLYVLDTDTLSLWQYGQEHVVRRVSEQTAAALAVTVITVQEQIEG